MIWPLWLMVAVDGGERELDADQEEDREADREADRDARPRHGLEAPQPPEEATAAPERARDVTAAAPVDDVEAQKLAAQVEEARRKLRDAISRSRPEIQRRVPQVGQKVDKYFGEKLPPVCERLGCYLTDDGKRFYCVNQTCQKHRKRDTKHTRVAKRPDRPTYFRCPRCESRHVDLLMFTDKYECRRCGHTWEKR